MAVMGDDIARARQVCRPNLVKQLMNENKLAHSFGLRIAFSVEMPIIIKNAGYSAALMNLEHMAMDLEKMKDICVTSLNVGITPIVVVPTGAPEWISRCLDSGAQAIIVPHINSAEEAQMCVNASKFPPLGKRSVTMVSAMMQYTTRIHYSAIAEVVNGEVQIMPMIETAEGLDNAVAIAAVPGVDIVMVGSADLCMDLGIPGQFESEEFHQAIACVVDAAEKASINGRKVFVGLGGLESRIDIIEMLAQKHKSIRFALSGRDIAFLLTEMPKHAASMNRISSKLI